MKLLLNQNYLSFQPFEIDLPDFTVITGKNGSGKTNLLLAIKNDIISNDITKDNSLTNFLNSNSFKLEPHYLTKSIDGRQHEIFERYNESKSRPDSEQKDFLDRIAEIVAKLANKNKVELNEDDFIKFTPINVTNYQGGIYNLDFFWDCFYYAHKLNGNIYNKFLASEGVKNTFFYSNSDFIKNFGEAPWNFMNKIFKSMQIEYEIETSDIITLNDFHVYFVRKGTKEKIQLTSLSSGEQVIILTAFSIFNIRTNFQTPKILLMDEGDSTLHPSMIKDFLRVLEDVFVKEKGIKVILTTHNPTTVALAPEESIYTMTRNSDVIKKTSKDAALKVLTEGVPAFSVNYENRRQVFVESHNDVLYYEKLYNIFSFELEADVSLNFIAAGDVQKNKNGGNKDGSSIVVLVTDKMSYNKFIYGIIDYDNKNSSNEHLKVLGQGNRYAIENYILDPILLGIFLLNKGLSSSESLNLSQEFNIDEIGNFDNDQLQTFVDAILNSIKENCDADNEDLVDCQLNNGKLIKIPKWFLFHPGHKLEQNIIKTFKKLEKYTNPESKLKNYIITDVISVFPELVSIDIVKTLIQVQK